MSVYYRIIPSQHLCNSLHIKTPLLLSSDIYLEEIEREENGKASVGRDGEIVGMNKTNKHTGFLY